jgi:hypothetical protein
MQLQAIVNPSLPKLAWVAEVHRGKGIVMLVHGSEVEARQNFFIEGVWNGPFEKADFGETDCVFGTGAILSDESVRFVTSASTTDYLFYAEDGDHVAVSNSLPLLLAYIQDALDPRCLEYPVICNSLMDGIDDYRRDIPTKRGSVWRQMYRNLNVTMEKIWESDKRMPPRFECFKDYLDYLRDNYALIAANARDTARTWPLGLWSTQSKGYDSTAINAIASRFGIDKVFTVSEAKNNFYLAHNNKGILPNDDGKDICDLLGLKCIRINRRAFAEEFDDEYLYYCALHHNQDVNLKEISKHITQAGILLTGTLGEMWYTKDCLGKRAFLDSKLRRWDLGGHGMSELRLLIGIIHLPLPYIGGRRREDIVNITESSEMDPWRLRNEYDRPIPRRIAEESGVPRQAFGQSKMGSVVLFCRPSIPYGKGLRREFFDYLINEKIMASYEALLWPIVRWVNSILILKSERRFAVVHYTERVLSKLTGREFHFKPIWSKLDGALFSFCVNRTAETYSEHLSRLKRHSYEPLSRQSRAPENLVPQSVGDIAPSSTGHNGGG